MREGVSSRYERWPFQEESSAGGAGEGGLGLGVSPLVTDDGVRRGQDGYQGLGVRQKRTLYLLLAPPRLTLSEADLRLYTDAGAGLTAASSQSVVGNVPAVKILVEMN